MDMGCGHNSCRRNIPGTFGRKRLMLGSLEIPEFWWAGFRRKEIGGKRAFEELVQPEVEKKKVCLYIERGGFRQVGQRI